MATTLMLRSTAPLVGKFQYASIGRRARALTRPVLAAKGGDSYQVSAQSDALHCIALHRFGWGLGIYGQNCRRKQSNLPETGRALSRTRKERARQMTF